MEILCTNDDGVNSPGLLAAVEVAASFGSVVVAAPSTQKTAAGRSLMGNKARRLSTAEIAVSGRAVPAYHSEESPAFVLRHAFATVLRGRAFDLAISGINYGENVGWDISTSGTVGAAIECSVRGIPSIAVSLQTELTGHHAYSPRNWDAAQFFLEMFIRRFLEKGGFRAFEILKIDVPMTADRHTRWRECRLHGGSYFQTRMTTDSREAPLSDSVLYTEPASFVPGTDAHTVAISGEVAVTPLQLDWTAFETGGFFG